MEDSSRQNRALVREIVMSKTVEERFLMCAEMYEEAKEIAKIGASQNLSETERDLYVFAKIHGAKPEELI